MEIANTLVLDNGEGNYDFYFKELTDKDVTDLGLNADKAAKAKFLSTKWGKDGANYVDGYVVIMGYNKGDDSNTVDQQIIAVQDKRSGQFFSSRGFKVELTKPVAYRSKFLNNHEAGITVMPNAPVEGDESVSKFLAAGRGVMSVKIEKDASLDANKFKEVAPWFDKNGEGVNKTMNDKTVSYNSNATLPINYYVRDEYKFLGWNTKADGTGTFFADKAKIPNLSSTAGEIVVLYAQWEPLNPSTTASLFTEGYFGLIVGGVIALGAATAIAVLLVNRSKKRKM